MTAPASKTSHSTTTATLPDSSPRPHTVNGRRNLLILGAAALAITVLTTGIELVLYRTSGDIYLDRSRPGFLPDPDDPDEEPSATESTYTYPDSGPLDKSELEEYLTELQALKSRLDKLSTPFSSAPLSNESLGIIPSSTPEPEERQ